MRKRKRSRSQMAAIDQINVTPLLDLTFLLLIVFMITMPLMEYGTNISPPEMNSDKLPTENFKSITAHATLLFNVLLLPFFGYIKADTKRNTKNIVLSIVMMAVVGAYCNLLYHALVSESAAYDVNSMFLIHSPFEGLDFLTYPVISLIAVPIYFSVFVICDLCVHKKGERFYNKKTSK